MKTQELFFAEKLVFESEKDFLKTFKALNDIVNGIGELARLVDEESLPPRYSRRWNLAPLACWF